MNDSTDPQRQSQPPRGAQEPPRAQPREQRPQIDQEQPHVEWPTRADGINGAPAEQPAAAKPSAENAQSPAENAQSPAEKIEPPAADGEAAGESEAKEPRPPRRAAKPRQRSRRRGSNGAGDKTAKPETVADADSSSTVPQQGPKDESKPVE